MGWIWGGGFWIKQEGQEEFEEGDDLVANQDTEDSWVLVVCFGEVASGKMGKMVKKQSQSLFLLSASAVG